MKKAILYIYLFLFFMTSCTEEKKTIVISSSYYDNIELSSFTDNQIKQVKTLYGQLVDTNLIFNINAYAITGVPAIAEKYKFDNIVTEEINKEEILKILYRQDTIKKGLIDTIQSHDFTSISGENEIRFLESWTYSKKPFEMHKEVQYLCPVVARYSNEGQLMGLLPLYYLEFNKGDDTDDLTVIENLSYVTPFDQTDLKYGPVNENDKLSFLDFVFGAIEEGTINAYLDYDKKQKVNSITDLEYNNDVTNRGKFITDEEGNPKYVELPDTSISYSLDINAIATLVFVEDWKFNVEKQVFKKKVNAIGFGTKLYSELNKTANNKQDKSDVVFWVFFE